MNFIPRLVATALPLAGLAGYASLQLIGDAGAQSATAVRVTKPLSLPDTVLGPASAPVTIVEYASIEKDQALLDKLSPTRNSPLRNSRST